MKFQRNLGDARAFRTAAILFSLFGIAFLIIYLVTRDSVFLRLLAMGAPTSLFCFYLAYSAGRDYVVFQEDKILFSNRFAADFAVNVSDIEAVLVPSQKALRNKWKSNEIIFKRASEYNSVSHTPEIEAYILEHLDVRVIYYDDRSKALRNKV
ncbi:MAG: hypothetical protein J6L87_08665 [Clostridia bacterium]|nr:hypothetical protein [Clostridia bacterium]